MLHKTRDFTKNWGWFNLEAYDKHIRKLAENRKKCSCYMCGNARRMFKEKTLQEMKFEAKGIEE